MGVLYTAERMKKQTGVALLVVLLIVALVSILATQLSQQLQREAMRSANVFDHLQAKQYVIGAEALGVALLEQHIAQSPSRDDLSQLWASKGVTYALEGGVLTGVITDKNQCFNLNSLVVQQGKESAYVVDKSSAPYVMYRRLLAALGLDPALSDALVDWLDTDSDLTGADGAEDLAYAQKSPAYRAANYLMTDVSELRLVDGYTAEVIEVLLPYVCVLPEASYLQVNVNTITEAQAALLMMIDEGLALDEAQAMIKQRPTTGYETLTAFWRQSALAGLTVDTAVKRCFKLDSDYFELSALAKVGRGQSRIITLFKQQGRATLQLISRQYGVKS